jgi:hypothetical protein
VSGRFDNDPLKRALGQQASAASRVQEFEAASASLRTQPEPEGFDAALALRERRAQAEARLSFARERLAAADAALAEAQGEARKQDLRTAKARLEREGDKRAATWSTRWDKAAAELIAIMEEIEADKRACRTLTEQLQEIGEVGLWCGEERHRKTYGLDHGDLGTLRVPAFEQRRGALWPKRVIW